VTSIQVLETLTLVAPLGVRFWDAVDNAPVSEGLSVAIWPKSLPELRIPAILNRSDVFAFPHLPGLRGVENGAGDADYWAATPPQFDFVLRVDDSYNRFLSFQLPVRLPIRGILDNVPLFSSPARTLAGPMGIIRAQLLDPIAAAPAAWTLVEARAGGVVARGMADAEGGLVLPLPYPEAQGGGGFGSPPGGASLRSQTWPVSLAFFYTPQHPAPVVPSLDQVLGQRPAFAWDDETLSTPLAGATLRFGQELVLRSRAALASPPAMLSTLLITAALSPP
jgi:hypothetical protein